MSARVLATLQQPVNVVHRMPERRFRHGKRVVTYKDLKDMGGWKNFDRETMGIRRFQYMKVAAGPTILKGKKNKQGNKGATSAYPEWAVEHLKKLEKKGGGK